MELTQPIAPIRRCIGTISQLSNDQRPEGHCVSRDIHVDEQIIVGRNPEKCNYVIGDPAVSGKHVRIYSIVVDQDDACGISPLVYAEDLSRNGTYWNKAWMGKGRGGFLLSDGDILQISSRIRLVFRQYQHDEPDLFDAVREREIKLFDHKYGISSRKLGAGAFGVVKMAVDRSSNSQLACKIVDLRQLTPKPNALSDRKEHPASAANVDSDDQMRKLECWTKQQKAENAREDKIKLYRREANILSKISHPNIIGLEKVYVTDNTIYILLELVTGGDLFSYLDSKDGVLQEIETAVIVRQLLIAVDYLHSQGIAHRDLKPENILLSSVSEGCRVVLTDFGAARTFNTKSTRMTTSVGTTEYVAPEVLGRPTGYTSAIDMWSIGCVTVVLLTGGSPFRDSMTGEYSQELARSCNLSELEQNNEWRRVSRRPKDFVKQLLIWDYKQRMSAVEALTHNWFTHETYQHDYDELYKRTIKGWKPRIPKQPLVEVLKGSDWKEISQTGTSGYGRNLRKRSPTPVDPPYKPYPRKMSKILMPNLRDRPRSSFGEEVKTAIEDNWPKSPRVPGRALRSMTSNAVLPSSIQKRDSCVSIDMRTSRPTHKDASTDIPARRTLFKSMASQAKSLAVTVTSSPQDQPPGSLSHGPSMSGISSTPKMGKEHNGCRSLTSRSQSPIEIKPEKPQLASENPNDPSDKIPSPSSTEATVSSIVTNHKQDENARRVFSPGAWAPSLNTSVRMRPTRNPTPKTPDIIEVPESPKPFEDSKLCESLRTPKLEEASQLAKGCKIFEASQKPEATTLPDKVTHFEVEVEHAANSDCPSEEASQDPTTKEGTFSEAIAAKRYRTDPQTPSRTTTITALIQRQPLAPRSTRLRSPAWSRRRSGSVFSNGGTAWAARMAKMKEQKKSSVFDFDEDECGYYESENVEMEGKSEGDVGVTDEESDDYRDEDEDEDEDDDDD